MKKPTPTPIPQPHTSPSPPSSLKPHRLHPHNITHSPLSIHKNPISTPFHASSPTLSIPILSSSPLHFQSLPPSYLSLSPLPSSPSPSFNPISKRQHSNTNAQPILSPAPSIPSLLFTVSSTMLFLGYILFKVVLFLLLVLGLDLDWILVLSFDFMLSVCEESISVLLITLCCVFTHTPISHFSLSLLLSPPFPFQNSAFSSPFSPPQETHLYPLFFPPIQAQPQSHLHQSLFIPASLSWL